MCLSQRKLNPDCLFDCLHFLARDVSDLLAQPLLRDCSDLVGHRLALPPANHHISFKEVKTLFTRRQRNDLNSVIADIEAIIRHDDRRSRLTDFAADRWIEMDPPDFTASDSRANH